MAQKRPLLRRSTAEGSRRLCIASPAVESLYLPLYKSPTSECATFLSCVRSTMVRWLLFCVMSARQDFAGGLAGGECQQANATEALDLMDGHVSVSGLVSGSRHASCYRRYPRVNISTLYASLFSYQ